VDVTPSRVVTSPSGRCCRKPSSLNDCRPKTRRIAQASSSTPEETVLDIGSTITCTKPSRASPARTHLSMRRRSHRRARAQSEQEMMASVPAEASFGLANKAAAKTAPNNRQQPAATVRTARTAMILSLRPRRRFNEINSHLAALGHSARRSHRTPRRRWPIGMRPPRDGQGRAVSMSVLAHRQSRSSAPTAATARRRTMRRWPSGRRQPAPARRCRCVRWWSLARTRC
jgi:hypothetical protein